MFYVCTTDRDFDDWSKQGNRGWDYASVLPYIKKSEGQKDKNILKNGTHHGSSGNLTVNSFKNDDPLVRIIQSAYNELGYKSLLDINSGQFNGFVKIQGTIRGGERVSSYRAFIEPARSLTNLYVMKNSVATKITLNGSRAIGVIVKTNNSKCPTIELKATKEVIVSAGALGSPKLLLLSGIGKIEDLEPFGIKQIKKLPVGESFQDHVYVLHFLKINSNEPEQSIFELLRHSKEYFFNRTGPMSQLGTATAQGFINTTDPNAKYPDVQMTSYRLRKSQEFVSEVLENYGFKDEFIEHLVKVNAESEILMTYITLSNPFSRGSVKLRSSDPLDDPLIISGFLTDSRDIEIMVRGIGKLKALVNTKAFQELSPSFIKFPITECDLLSYPSSDYDKCYLKYFTTSGLHPSSTCKMGRSSDPSAVVDSQLRVHGYSNLRVVDASIMPTITTGNTQCPVYMIGQKAADMIKETWRWKESEKILNLKCSICKFIDKCEVVAHVCEIFLINF